MSVQVDWQILDEGEQWPGESEEPPTPPPVKPRWRPSRRLLIALAVALVAAIAGAAGYLTWTYRTRLEQVKEPVQALAAMEARAVAANDRATFMALQDPDDPAWRALQSERFGRLESMGVPEFGWRSTGAPPVPGQITLEPGGATLQMTHQFSVTRGLPNGPDVISLRVPQYYRQTSSGWVRALPPADYWGAWRNLNGKRFAMRYSPRDAALLEPLVKRMDVLLEQVCQRLPCPPQPIYAEFDNYPEALSRLSNFSYGFDENGFVLQLVSPQLIGVPADARSREELYRAIATRVIQALVYEASQSHLNMNYWAAQEIVRHELALAGLSGPFLNDAMLHALPSAFTTPWMPLSDISLRSRPTGLDNAPSEALTPLAFAFLEQFVGKGTVTRLLPVIDTSSTLGAALRAIEVTPAKLEPDWQRFSRSQAGLPVYEQPAPQGELALRCVDRNNQSSIWSVWAYGTGLSQVSSNIADAWLPIWSPNGQKLAYIQDNRLMVVNTSNSPSRAILSGLTRDSSIGWLSDDRIEVRERTLVRWVDANTGQSEVASGRTLSPDGKYLVYSAGTIWLSKVGSGELRQLGTATTPAWSPDSTRLAFLVRRNSLYPTEVRLYDVISDSVTTLVRSDQLESQSTRNTAAMINGLFWSPDSSMLAVMTSRSGAAPAVVVVNTQTGQVRARLSGVTLSWPYSYWSPDSRYLALWMTVASRRETLMLLDVQTGQSVEIHANRLTLAASNQLEQVSSNGFDWSPDGRWLAVTQEVEGVLLITPDLSSLHWVDTPNCYHVAWKPVGR